MLVVMMISFLPLMALWFASVEYLPVPLKVSWKHLPQSPPLDAGTAAKAKAMSVQPSMVNGIWLVHAIMFPPEQTLPAPQSWLSDLPPFVHCLEWYDVLDAPEQWGLQQSQ